MSNCKTCKYFDGGAVVGNKDEPCYSCLTASDGWLPYYEEATEKMTNADKVRGMSDDELADFMDENDPVYWDRDTWLKWLKSPVEVDNVFNRKG